MYKQVTLITFFCLIFNTISAQHIQFDWQNCIKGGKWETTGSSISETDSGYFITAMQEMGTNMDIVLVKTTLTGDSLWTRYYGGSGGDSPCGVFPTMDGNFYIVGTECSNDGDITNNPYPGSCNIWIIKIDGSGNIIWDKIYGGTDYDVAWNAMVSLDGGLAILCSTFSNDGDITNYFSGKDIWILKVDSIGNKQWDFTMGSLGYDYAYGIQQLSDSSYFVSGCFNMGKGGNIDCSYSDSSHVDGLLFQLDKNGNLLQQKCYHGSGDDVIRSVVELPDGYLISGSTNSADIASSNIGFHPGYSSTGNPTGDIWLQKTDFNWNIEWQRCYGGSGDEDINRLYQCSNGDYMMFGTTRSNNGDVSGIHNYDPTHDTEPDIWMVRLNETGDILWQRCIGAYERQELSFNGVIKLGEADYVIACTSDAGGSDDILCEPNLHKIQPFVWLFQITDSAASVGINQTPQIIEAKLYPNPAHQFATVEIPVTYTLQNAYAEIIDASGRTLEKFKVREKQLVINVSGFTKGIYLIRINGTKNVITKRFIVE